MNIAIMGNGAMGKLVRDIALKDELIDKVWIIEPLNNEKLLNVEADVIIDFSHPDNLDEIFDYVKHYNGKTGVVVATTGYNQDEEVKKK